jgi:hypothetical protein
MNNALKTIAAAAFLFAVAAPRLHAQTNLETGASNSVAAPDEALVVTTVPGSGALTPNQTNSSAESSPVRMDNAGVHTGGQNQGENNSAALGGLAIGALTMLIPFAPFVMIVLVVAIVFYFRYRHNKMAHETLRAMIEKGVPVTPELIANLKNKGTRLTVEGQIPNRGTGRLLVGLILVGAGIGTVIIAGKPGFIPLFVGAAFLIVWLVERGNTNNPPPPNPPPPGQ